MEKVVQRIRLGAVRQAGGVKHQRLNLFARLVCHTPAAAHHAGVIGHAEPLGQALVGHCLCAHGLESRDQRTQQLGVATATNQHTAFNDRLAGLEALQRQRLRKAQHGCNARAQG